MDPAFKRSLIISAGLHLLLVVLLVANFSFFRSEEVLVMPMPGDMAAAVPLKATTVDKSAYEEQVKEIKEKKEQERKTEERKQKQIEEDKRRVEREKRQAEQQKKQQELEKKKQEQEKKLAAKKAADEKKRKDAEAEKQKKLDAEKKKKDQEKKKQQELEKKEKEKAAKEKAAKEKAEKEKAEKEKRERDAAEEMMQEQMEAEAEARRAAKAGQILTEKQRYLAMIVAKIQQNWFVDDTMRGKECRVNIRLAPNGFVISSTVLDGDRALCESAMRAIQKAGNFPMSPDPDVYDALKDLTPILKPELR
ncbi:cell envelope integrity protein TolA [Rheinheimera sp.]|uniref:cell envelope integrity protein TolA n=1 Tax=Rheinheimera sp. TaxID=1869214 RepID=UPI003AF4E96E